MPADNVSLATKLLSSLLSPLLNMAGIIIAFYWAYKLYKWKRSVKAPVWAWERYIEKLIEEEQYELITTIQALLTDKDRFDTIETPKGFKVRKDKNLDLADRYDNMTFVVSSSYIFTRKDGRKDEFFKVKDQRD